MSQMQNSIGDQPSKTLLVGPPNSGKTTLYNWLTASHFKVVNYPGSTVDFAEGNLADRWKSGDGIFVDTPGIYSLNHLSPDEAVTQKLLSENPNSVAIVVVDGLQLRRHLKLVNEMRILRMPIVVAVTMADLLKRDEIQMDLKKLANILGCPVVAINGRLGKGLPELIQAIPSGRIAQEFDSERVAQEVLDQVGPGKTKLATDKLDQVLLHPILGLVIFSLVMAFVFTAVFSFSSPFMDLIDSFFGWTQDLIKSSLPQHWFVDFFADGFWAGLGSITVFTPQIFILFMALGILEDSGYLARGATLFDKPLAKLGLSGRSFLPLMSGFACAVPAIMATRHLSGRKERLITSFVIPLLTCSARLPVYSLLIGFLFLGRNPWFAGLALASLYLVTMVVGALAAGLIGRMVKKSDVGIFALELPMYRRPQIRQLIVSSFKRTLSYVFRAGPVILALSVLLWGLAKLPLQAETDGPVRIEKSFLGQAGLALEPVFQKMGSDWRVGVGLISAFAAREVFVSSLALVFDLSAEGSGTEAGPIENSLLARMTTAKNALGSPLFTWPSVLALIFFFMIALQCISTFAIMWKESRSPMLALLQLFGFNLIAYLGAVAIFQLGQLF